MSIKMQSILFLNIQCIPQYPSYKELPLEAQQVWLNKWGLAPTDPESTLEQIYQHRAAQEAEFGKITCISCGRLMINDDHKEMEVISFSGWDEKDVLQRWAFWTFEWLTGAGPRYFCADRGKELVYPYLCQRLLVHNLTLPYLLYSIIKNQRLIRQLDTAEIWQFGSRSGYESVATIGRILQVPTPAEDMDEDMIREAYWKENDLTPTITRSRQAVIELTQVFVRLHCEPLIKEENIFIHA